MRCITVCVALLFVPTLVVAQAPEANPYTTAIRDQNRRINAIVTRAAEKVPEEIFAFKPTPEVRSFGEIVGHIIDAHYLLCRAAHENVFDIKREHEQKPGTKTDLLGALKKSSEYCERAFAATTDTNGTTPIKVGNSTMQKLMVLNLNVSHTWEHYGNLVTYMRLKGIVPPTSEPAR